MTDDELKAEIEKRFSLWEVARWVEILDLAKHVRDAERERCAMVCHKTCEEADGSCPCGDAIRRGEGG